MKRLLCLLLVWVGAASAQPCPDKNVMYWQAFPPGGETDIVGAPPADRAEEEVPGDRHDHPVQARRRRRR